jgi:hypothetical protein
MQCTSIFYFSPFCFFIEGFGLAYEKMQDNFQFGKVHQVHSAGIHDFHSHTHKKKAQGHDDT